MKSEDNILASSLSVEDFITKVKIISIPRYQREYAWEKKNVETLINDVKPGYYLGNIITFGSDDKKEIIDGQQRLITIFLILIAIRNLTSDENLKSKIDSIILNENGCKLFLDERIGVDGSNVISLILDDKNLESEDAKKYNESKSYEAIKIILKSKGNLEKVYFSLINSMIVDISFGNKEVSAHEMFVNVNTKGKPLTEIEVIKSQLFKYLLVGGHSDVYKEKWQEMLNSIPQSEYDDFVSDTYLFDMFDQNPDKSLKTSGTIKENYLELLNSINSEDRAVTIFNLMTGDKPKDIYKIYRAIKNHDILYLCDNYFSSRLDSTSFSEVDAVWKLYGEFGFRQSDVLFVSLFRDKEAFLSDVNYFTAFMLYLLCYELSRSVFAKSPAGYANGFKQYAMKLSNEKDPTKIRLILKELIDTLSIDYDSLKEELCKLDKFKKNYRLAKFIIMIAEGNHNSGLKVEHFIYQKTKNDKDINYVGCIGNLIPVLKDKYKDKSIEEKLLMYSADITDVSIKNFLSYGFDTDNYIEKILERTSAIVEKFIETIKDLEEIIKGCK